MNIPNIITLLHIACGMMVIILSGQGLVYEASLLLLCCVVLDVIDGFAARFLVQISQLGMQLDSLADVISFGVGSAMIVLSLVGMGWRYLLFLICFVMAGAWRLARHNTLQGSLICSSTTLSGEILADPKKNPQKSFQRGPQKIGHQHIGSDGRLGMPITVNGMVIPLMVRWNVSREMVMIWIVVSVGLMVSTIRIPKPSLLSFFFGKSHTVSK